MRGLICLSDIEEYIARRKVDGVANDTINRERAALSAGMRLSEILMLTWDRVHIDAVISPFIELTQTKSTRFP